MQLKKYLYWKKIIFIAILLMKISVKFEVKLYVSTIQYIQLFGDSHIAKDSYYENAF